jgi:hypothetical protein
VGDARGRDPEFFREVFLEFSCGDAGEDSPGFVLCDFGGWVGLTRGLTSL